MSQNFEKLVLATAEDGGTTFGALYPLLNASLEALRTCFSGTEWPLKPTIGQSCLRTDIGTKPGTLYTYSGDMTLGSSGWIESALVNKTVAALVKEVAAARGSAATLWARLDTSLEQDGSLKSEATASVKQWDVINDCVWMGENQFSTLGDQTDALVPSRALRFTDSDGFVTYGYVESSEYGTETLAITSCAVPEALAKVEYGLEVKSAPHPIVDNSETQFSSTYLQALVVELNGIIEKQQRLLYTSLYETYPGAI